MRNHIIISGKELTLLTIGIIILLTVVFFPQICLLLPLDRKARYQQIESTLSYYPSIASTKGIDVSEVFIPFILRCPEEMYICETEKITFTVSLPDHLNKGAMLYYLKQFSVFSEVKKTKWGISLDGPTFDVTPKGFVFKQLKSFPFTWTWVIKPKSPGTSHLLLMDFEGFPLRLFYGYKWSHIRGSNNDIQSLRDPQPIDISVLTELGLTPRAQALLEKIGTIIALLVMCPIVGILVVRLWDRNKAKTTPK